MVSRTHVLFKVADRSFFAIIKKDIHALAGSAGFSENKIAQIDIIVAELVSNLVKHAGGGVVLAKLFEEDGMQGMELISIDNGPGMTDVSRMVADGVSTKNTLGNGLGAMKRLSDLFQVYSQKGWGTVMLIRVKEKKPSQARKPTLLELGELLVPKPGETACGDGFFVSRQTGFIKFLLGDGLGHGREAEIAVLRAGEAFAGSKLTEPVDILRSIHTEVKKTRGLVCTVCVFDMNQLLWKICGVGNITTKINSPSANKNYSSYNGIVGLNMPNTLNSQSINYEKGQLLIMCSDGLKSRWDSLQYPSIHRYDPSLLSASIFKDFARNTDDMSIATCKINL